MNSEAPSVLLQQKNKQNILNKIRDNKAKCQTRQDSISSRQASFSLKRGPRPEEFVPRNSQFYSTNSVYRVKEEADRQEVDQTELGTSIAWLAAPQEQYNKQNTDETEQRNVMPRLLPPLHGHLRNTDFAPPPMWQQQQMMYNPADAYFKQWVYESNTADTQHQPMVGPAAQFGGTQPSPPTANDQVRFPQDLAIKQFGFRQQQPGPFSSLALPSASPPRQKGKGGSYFAQNYKFLESQRALESSNSATNFGPEKEDTIFEAIKSKISKMLGLKRASTISDSSSHLAFHRELSDVKREEKRKKERRVKSVVTQLEEKDPEKELSSSDLHEDNFQQINIMGENQAGHVVQETNQSDAHIKVGAKKEKWVIKADSKGKLIWNSCVGTLSIILALWLPVSLAFQVLEDSYFLDWTGHAAFLLDLILNSRTTMFHPETGEILRDPSSIRKLYLRSWGFLVDTSVVVPIWLFLDTDHFNFRLLAILKLVRLQPMLIFNFHSENMRLSLKILNLMGYLLLYIHLTACYFYFVAAQDQEWAPWQARFADSPKAFYLQGFATKYFTSLYTAILILMGNDTNPESDWHVVVVCLFSITGALFIANIFGTITMVVSTLNRKAQKFQDNIDMANTCMANMKLPVSIQQDIREFMMSTHNNLDTQKELDSFMQIVSPSLRNKVTKHIFINAIASNPVLQGSQEAVDFLINDVSTLLYMPEDRIISQGEHGDSLFLIAKGSCSVWVVDHMRQLQFVKQLNQGEHFGEVSILYETPRTATVKSANYCTLASLSKKTFFNLCNSFPQIIVRMRERTLEYKDPWKQFKRKVIAEVEFFKEAAQENPFFLDEVSYHLDEEYFEKGSEIVGPDCSLKQIIFIVQGAVDLIVFDQNGDEKVLQSLGQGDTIGQYSSLFDETPIFSAVAKTRVRVLTLDQEFFTANKDVIVGLEDSILACEDLVESNGIPLCDYSRFYKPRGWKAKLRNAIRKAQILESSLLLSQSQVSSKKEKKQKSAVRRKEESNVDLSIYAKKKRGSIFLREETTAMLAKRQKNSITTKLSPNRLKESNQRLRHTTSRPSVRHDSGSFKLKSPLKFIRSKTKAPWNPKRTPSREESSVAGSSQMDSSSSSSSSGSSQSLSSSINKEESFGNIQSPDTHLSRTSQHSNTGGSQPRRKSSRKSRKRGSRKQNRVQFEICELKSPEHRGKAVPTSQKPSQFLPKKTSDQRVAGIDTPKDLSMYVLSEHSFEESSCSASGYKLPPVPKPKETGSIGDTQLMSPDQFRIPVFATRQQQPSGFPSEEMFDNMAPRVRTNSLHHHQPSTQSRRGENTMDQSIKVPNRHQTCTSSISSNAKEISLARSISKRMRNLKRN